MQFLSNISYVVQLGIQAREAGEVPYDDHEQDDLINSFLPDVLPEGYEDD